MPFATDTLDEPPDPNLPRSTLASRRRAWVIEALKAGRTHPDIADKLGITGERVRQIAKEALAGHSVEPEREHVHVQIARLIPALTLAGDAVDRGNVRAIGPLIKILDRLDSYQARVMTLDMLELDSEYSDNIKKFNKHMDRIKEDFRKIGLADQVETRAEAYAAAQVLAEAQSGRAAPATAHLGEDHEGEDWEPNQEPKPNWDDPSD